MINLITKNLILCHLYKTLSMDILSGNNNCGKTTIFKAIEFIQTGKNKEDYITKGKESEDISVEIEFRGHDVKDIINDENLNLKNIKTIL